MPVSAKTVRIPTSSILQLSSDLLVVIEVVDHKEKIEAIKPIIDQSVKEGLVTEEPVIIYLNEAGANPEE